MKSKFNVFKILYYVGISTFVIGFILLCNEYIPLLFACLLELLSCFMMLPDSVLFVIQKYRENNRFGIYWIVKFTGLIIAIFIYTIGFFQLLFK